MAFKVKNRHKLKIKKIKNFENELMKSFSSISFDERSSFEIGDFNSYKIIFINNEPCFIFHENKLLFTLHGLNIFKPKENFVVVDMGAIKFITNGADIMAPGIIDADKNIKKNDQVWICDEKHKKALAIGISIMDGSNMIKEEKGKAIKTIHWVGDSLWNFTAKSL